MFKYILYALVSGLLLGFSWPTKGVSLFIFIAFVPLLLAEHKLAQNQTKRKGLKVLFLSYISFFIWNAIAYYWLHFAKQYNAETGEFYNSWLVAYGVPVLLNSLFMSLVFWLFHKVKKIAGNYYGLFFLPCIWMAFEKLHLNWEISFPWLNLGNAFASDYKWVQWYSVTGAFGGTLWIWLSNLVGFFFIYAYKNTSEKKYLYRLAVILPLLIGVPIAGSYLIYANYEEQKDPITALVIQPEMNPYYEKYTLSREQLTDKLVALSMDSLSSSIDFVVTPETSFPGRGKGLIVRNLRNDYLLNKFDVLFQKNPNTVLVAGVELMQLYGSEDIPSKTSVKLPNSRWHADFYNSAILYSPEDSLQIYHKSKLVVGPEMIPYSRYLKPLFGTLGLAFGEDFVSLTTQKNREVFRTKKSKAVVAPIVCWESIFGEFTTEYVKEGANVFFIMTNDSWWDETDGHRELLAYGRLRAIENRRSIVRAANSGISGFINQRGDLVKSIPYEYEGSLSGTVNLNSKETIYSQYGDVIARIALFFAGVIMAYTLASRFSKFFKKSPKRNKTR